MSDDDKTRDELLTELQGLRERLAELERERLLTALGRLSENLRAELGERRKMELALRASEQRWRTLVEHAPEFISSVDRKLHIQFINRVARGFLKEDVIGSSILEYLPSEEHERIRAIFADVFAHGASRVFETRSRFPDGSIRWFESRVGPIIEDRRVSEAIILAIDVTDRRRTEEEQRSQTRVMRSILDSMGDGVVVADSSGRFVLWNPAAERITRIGPVDLPPSTWTEHYGIYKPDGSTPLPFEELPLVRAIRGETIDGAEVFLRPKGMDAGRWINVTGRPLRDDSGQARGGVIVFRDTTQQKHAEDEVRRRNRELAALNSIIGAAGSSLELAEVMPALTELLARQLGVPAGAVFTCEDREDAYLFQGSWGLTGPALERLRELDSAVLVQRLAEPSCQAPPTWSGDSPFAACLCVPLVAKDERQGVLCLFAERPGYFNDEQTAFLRIVGQQLGVAVQNARLFEEVRAGRQRLQSLSHRLVEVQEVERRHLARELHDEVGQALTGVWLRLDLLDRAPDADRPRHLADARSAVARLMELVRGLSLNLRPAMLDDLGLLPALLWQFNQYAAQTGVEVAFRHSGLEQRFPREVETAAYRIIQEALTNVARHAQTREVDVRVWANTAHLGMQVVDRGVGFDPDDLRRRRDTGGVSGMHERATLLGGQLVMESKPGGGTRLTAELPLAESPNGSQNAPHHRAGG